MTFSFTITETNCRVCRHRSKHRQDVLGKIRCEECPDEVCTRVLSTAPEPDETHPIEGTGVIAHVEAQKPLTDFMASSGAGARIIHEMTRAELISEILVYGAEELQGLSVDRLRTAVANWRVSRTTKAIYAEAGVQPERRSIFGEFFE